MQKVVVIENDEFTKGYGRVPPEHRARVTVILNSGERLVGESGGDHEDMSEQASDSQVSEKFRGLTEDVLGTKRSHDILNRLWSLEPVMNLR